MKCLLSCVMAVALIVSASGCSQIKPGDGTSGGGGTNWNQVGVTIENLTELSAMVAFTRDDAKQYKEDMCNAVANVSNVLNNFKDTDATFDSVRVAALNAVKDLDFPKPAKDMTVLVVDQVLDVVFAYARDSYANLLESNEATVALTLSRAVANGLNNACQASMSTFGVQKSGFGAFSVTKQ